MSLASLLVIGLLLATACVVHAKFLTEEELQSKTCSSTFHQVVTRANIGNPPNKAIDILVVPDKHKKYVMECLELFDDGPPSGLGTEDARTCANVNPTVQLCWHLASETVPNWACELLSPDIFSNPRTRKELTGPNNQDIKVKITWQPQVLQAACYPRDITTQFVGHSPRDPKENSGASWFFIVLVFIFVIMAVCFGVYMLWKVTRKFSKRDANPPGIDMLGGTTEPDDVAARMGNGAGALPVEDDPRKYGSGQLQPIDFYGEQEKKVDSTVLEDGETVLESRPLPRPWFRRQEYDVTKRRGPVETITHEESDYIEGSASRSRRGGGMPSQSPIDRRTILHGGPAPGERQRTPMRQQLQHMYDDDDAPSGSRDTQHGTGSASYRQSHHGVVPITDGLRNRRSGRSPSMDHSQQQAQNGRGGGRGPSHMYEDGIAVDGNLEVDYDDEEEEEDEEGEEEVMTCRDCMLPVLEESTPQYCRVTGKRHR